MNVGDKVRWGGCIVKLHAVNKRTASGVLVGSTSKKQILMGCEVEASLKNFKPYNK